MADPLRERRPTERFVPNETRRPELEDFIPTKFERPQGVNHRLIRDREPSVREVGEQEIVFSIVSGVKKMHTKIDGAIVSVTLA